jgi:small GTP-binding protein
MHILSAAQESLLQRERIVLNDLQLLVTSFHGSKDDLFTLKTSIQQMDDFFLLVIVGEFNAGKSSFINALLGAKILKEGVTPTTTKINIIRYGENHSEQVIDENTLLLKEPAALLSEISIVDTPGTNAIIREHEKITSQFIPRSDLVLFITSADRPLSESERTFLETIRDWGKKLVVIINKVDLVESNEEIEQIEDFVTENIKSLLGIQTEVFPISAKKALNAKLGEPNLWQESRFEAVENHIRSILDEEGRIKLKLQNPLGVGLNIANRYQKVIQERLIILEDDIETIHNIENQSKLHKEDMLHDFEFRMADIENILFGMEQRGQQFFDEYLRIGRIPDLINKNKIQDAFTKIVITDVSRQIEVKVDELIDWMIDRDFRQWKAIMDHLSKRKQKYDEKIIGDPINTTFNYDRSFLIESVAKEAEHIIADYDREKEASEIASGAQNAVAAAAAIEVGAIGLGTLITILATTLSADVTGILVASGVAVLGLFVIPARRRKANREMSKKIEQLKDNLTTSLRKKFSTEIDRSLERIHNAILPYTRFVRAERANLEETQLALEEIQKEILDIQNQINHW